LLLADEQRRKREHLQSVLEYMYLNLTVLPHTPTRIRKQVVSLLRKPVWVESLKGEIPHTEERSTLNELVVSCDPEVFKQAPATLFVGADNRSAYLRKSLRRCREAIVVDYLPVPRCLHRLKLQQFTFSELAGGETIKMCPDCTTFDVHRERVLKTGHVDTPTREYINFYNLRLKELARSLSTQWSVGTLAGGYQLCNDCGLVLTNGDGVNHRHSGHYTHKTCNPLIKPLELSEDAYPIPKSWLKGSLQELERTTSRLSTGRVNTVGNVGTDHDGEHNDASARDRRAKQCFNERQGKEPKTHTWCRCCGEDIYDRAGVIFCPDTYCRQIFQEGWVKGLDGLLLRTGMRLLVWQNNDALLKEWKKLTKNRS
jgi:hypothetical protein